MCCNPWSYLQIEDSSDNCYIANISVMKGQNISPANEMLISEKFWKTTLILVFDIVLKFTYKTKIQWRENIVWKVYLGNRYQFWVHCCRIMHGLSSNA
jgi:hypothetical protein